ncbi:MAG: peptidylprolyl isomerase [Tateyamaria sp.]|uniref:peptidylprolyl isomerase n=1 Tax=Tateyamaria sp. TaxID=1929288 RepID=UPI0032DDB60E
MSNIKTVDTDNMGPILREPLVHFVVIGALLFAAFGYLNPEPAEVPNKIVVTTSDIEVLEQAFQSNWRRPPNDAERAAIIDAHVRQEVLVREAEGLGLDRNDAIIRQRLQQKMDFLLSSGANAVVPTDEELETFLNENSDRYLVSGKMAFEQVYLGQRATADIVTATLTSLNAGTDRNTIGERTLLPGEVPLSTDVAIDGTFGTSFAATLAGQPIGTWTGPVQSGYGIHVVRVIEQTPARQPALAEVRDMLESEWRAERAEELSDAIYEDLRERYTIEIQMSGT